MVDITTSSKDFLLSAIFLKISFTSIVLPTPPIPCTPILWTLSSESASMICFTVNFLESKSRKSGAFGSEQSTIGYRIKTFPLVFHLKNLMCHFACFSTLTCVVGPNWWNTVYHVHFHWLISRQILE